jgi:hypothetical protein
MRYVFDSYILNRTVNVTGVVDGFMGLAQSNSNYIQYYVTNCIQNKIFVFDENWNYVSNKSSFTYVMYMIPVGIYFYITGQNNVWKTDQELNVLIEHTDINDPSYRGLYYNSKNDLIYVAPFTLQVIHVFNLNLTLNDSISITPYQPWSINENNNELYVGTTNGTILVIVNKQIIKQFNGCNEQSVILNSILFDDFNNMATSCNNNQLYLYNTTVNYLNQSIPTVSSPMYIGFDLKSRLVVVTNTQILLYVVSLYSGGF